MPPSTTKIFPRWNIWAPLANNFACCSSSKKIHPQFRKSPVCGCYVQNNYWESHRSREKGEVPYVVCGGPLVGFTLPLAIAFQSRWVLGITPRHPLCSLHPQIFVGQNLLPEKYLGSKYFSSSRFLGNIARVKFWRKIFPELLLVRAVSNGSGFFHFFYFWNCNSPQWNSNFKKKERLAVGTQIFFHRKYSTFLKLSRGKVQ